MNSVAGQSIFARSGGPKTRVLIISTHLRRDRTDAPPRDLLQPITGLHVAAMLDDSRYEIDIFNESWSGPYRLIPDHQVDIVFLTGTQADFDRMRQLSCHFRRQGTLVIAGGSICTLFPQFAKQFFDVVCVGTVEAARDAIQDFEAGELKQIYTRTGLTNTDYAVAYAPMERAGIRLPYHLIEASRGCKFKCNFCVIPAEKANKARYDLSKLRESINDSLAQAPWWSVRARYPLIWFVDNNFADDPAYLDALLELLQNHPRVRAWGALITQNILRDEAIMRRLRNAGCRAVFSGVESTDIAFLKQFNKTQNLGRDQNVWSDIKRAEAMGIAVSYGLLFDPMLSTVEEMDAEIAALCTDPLVPFPAFFSFVIPLAGTGFFWDCVREGKLAPNLMLRDLDGQTIGFRTTRSATAQVSAFAHNLFRNLGRIISRRRVAWSILRRAIRVGGWNPLIWAVVFSGSARMMWMRPNPNAPERSFVAGQDKLDPQYFETPPDISPEDHERYFAPIKVTDEHGTPVDWVLAAAPVSRKLRSKGEKRGDSSCSTTGATYQSGAT